jgi:uncharacterized ParB-like nuclease family protein
MITPIVLDLSKNRIDGGTQPRAGIDESAVADYAERITVGDEFPPVDVFQDGANYWLADGFHRYHGHARAGKSKIAATIHKGTCRDAILFSVGVNDKHGLRRTNEDKRKAVETLLKDEEWSKWSDHEIARQCAVSQSLVLRMRGGASNFKNKIDPSGAPKTAIRGGKPYTVNTANIGGKSTGRPRSEPDDDAIAEAFGTSPAPKLASDIMEADPVQGMEELPATPEVAFDMDGSPIQQENIRSIFGRRSELQQFATALTNLKSAVLKNVESHDPLFKQVDAANFKAAIEAARFAITCGIPYGICPKCGGESVGGRCGTCKGSGWLGKTRYENADAEMRKAGAAA